MPLVGDVLADRYRIDGPLGAGGMASVWRARDLRLGRDVAVKILLPNLSADGATATRFDREARSLAAAAHPSVVAVFDVEPGDPTTGREPFYVMELCDGGSLADRLARRGRLAPQELAPIVAAVADGLADLHRRGMVHRDVKPHNILFCDGRPKLADFGLARLEGDGLDALTATGTTIGTLAYLAPEQLAGAAATPASDVYALGVVAFQALTGRLPRPAGSVTQVVEARGMPAAKVSEAAPELGTAWDEVLAPALSPDPAARPTPGELAAGLARAPAPPGTSTPASGAAVIGAAATLAAPQRTDPTAATAPITPPPDIRVAGPGAEPPAWLEGSRLPGGRASQRRRSRPALAAIALAALVIAGLLAASSLLGERRARDPGTGVEVTPPVSAESTAPPTQAATPLPATEPPVAPPVDPAAEPGLAALPEVIDRIADARAAGLADNHGDNLERRAEQVGAALRAGDLDSARRGAEQLVEQVDKVEDDLEDEVADPLLRAVEALRDAIPTG